MIFVPTVSFVPKLLSFPIIVWWIFSTNIIAESRLYIFCSISTVGMSRLSRRHCVAMSVVSLSLTIVAPCVGAVRFTVHLSSTTFVKLPFWREYGRGHTSVTIRVTQIKKKLNNVNIFKR